MACGSKFIKKCLKLEAVEAIQIQYTSAAVGSGILRRME